MKVIHGFHNRDAGSSGDLNTRKYIVAFLFGLPHILYLHCLFIILPLVSTSVSCVFVTTRAM